MDMVTRMTTPRTTTTTRSVVIRMLAVMVGLGLTLTAWQVVAAHAEHERSLPAANAVINTSPDTVQIWFTQELFKREGANTIVVEGPDGRVDDATPILDDADREHLTVGLASGLPPGVYEVTWTSLSAIDGDSAEGSWSFTIDPDAEPSTPEPSDTEGNPTPEATATTAPAASSSGSDGSSFPVWALIAAGSIALATAIGAWALLRGEPGAGPVAS